jgi:hypothetical protein
MEEYSSAVVWEGDDPLGAADLSVYVASVPSRGQRLLVRRAAGQPERTSAKALRHLLGSPRGVEQLLDALGGPLLVGVAREHPELVEGMRSRMLTGPASAGRGLPRKPQQRWAIAPRWSGIEHAQLVVVNMRAQAERGRAERLVLEVGRLRRDAAMFDSVLRGVGTRIPVTAVAANAADSRDRGLIKALTRVMRTIGRVAEG